MTPPEPLRVFPPGGQHLRPGKAGSAMFSSGVVGLPNAFAVAILRASK